MMDDFCSVCNVDVDRDDMIKNEDGELICENCYEVCIECSDIITDGDFWTNYNMDIVCQGCIDEYYSACGGCDGYFHSDELTKYVVKDYVIVAMNGRKEKMVVDKMLCEDCHERIKGDDD